MTTFDVRIKVDASDHKTALRNARRQVGRKTKAILQDEGEQHVLPTARRKVDDHVPSKVAAQVVVRASSSSASLTAKRAGPLADILGLAEFGGTVRVKLSPKSAAAMRTPWGPRAVVAGPRTYKPRGGMRMGVQVTLGRYEDAVADRMSDILTGELR